MSSLEILLHREHFNEANRLLSFLSDGKHHLYITAGGFYGLLFTVDKYFRKVLLMQNPIRTESVRAVIRQILSIVDVAGQDKQTLLDGISDMGFMDLEDSCQHQAAISTGCDYLLTFNVKDYPMAAIPVLTPQEFMSRLV